jgi:hypothetical protein
MSETAGLRRVGWKIQALVGVFGLLLLWQAIEFGLAGSWPAAVFLFLAFGGFEAFAFVAVPYMFGSRKIHR